MTDQEEHFPPEPVEESEDTMTEEERVKLTAEMVARENKEAPTEEE
jgi:hypothetical protein